LHAENRVTHAVARCRWCKGRFVRVYGFQWLCESIECAYRQVADAVVKDPWPTEDGVSPFLFLPLPLQVDIEELPVKRLLVHGPAGIAKSYGGRWHLYKRCRKIRGYRALLLRCTYDQLYKNHLQFMTDEAAQLGDAKFINATNQPKQMKFANGSVVFFGYCDSESDIDQHMGPEYDEIVFEEGVHFLPTALNRIASRDRGSAPSRESRAKLGIVDGRTRILTNPGGRASLYLEDHYINRAPDPAEYPKYDRNDYGAISGDVPDNPYLPENYLSATLGGLQADRYEQLAHGRWDVFPGQFFGTFNPSVHVMQP
jgi:hypothetical protein